MACYTACIQAGYRLQNITSCTYVHKFVDSYPLPTLLSRIMIICNNYYIEIVAKENCVEETSKIVGGKTQPVNSTRRLFCCNTNSKFKVAVFIATVTMPIKHNCRFCKTSL